MARALEPNGLAHRQILVLLKLKCTMEDIFEEHKSEDAVPPAAASEFYRACQQRCHLQELLYRTFLREEDLPTLFCYTSNLNCLLRIAAISSAIRPRRTWCFAGEDYMSVVKTWCAHCIFGENPHHACAKVVQHYRLGMHFQMDI